MPMFPVKKLIVFGVAIELIVALTACVTSSPLTLSETLKVSTDASQPLNAPDNAMAARYRRAEQRLPVNLLAAVDNLYFTPHWLDDGGFWYALRENSFPKSLSPKNSASKKGISEKTSTTRYFRYHQNTGTVPLFDENRLLQALNLGKRSGDAPLEQLSGLVVQKVELEGKAEGKPEGKPEWKKGAQITRLRVRINDNDWQCELSNPYRCYYYANNTGQGSAGSVAGTDSAADSAKQSNGIVSPDGSWQILVKQHNLVLHNQETGELQQLTEDGSAEHAYATNSPNPKTLFNQPEGSVEPGKAGYWSPDSRYFVTFQLDLRHTGKLHLQQSVTGKGLRPRVYPYHYPMAGDDQLIKGQLVVVSVTKQSVQRINTPALLQTYYGNPLWGEFASNNKYYFVERERGFHTFHLKELSPDTGIVRTLITETNDKFIDPWVQDFRVVPELDRVFWTSERSGMQQLYVYQLNALSPILESTTAPAPVPKTPGASLLRAVTPAHLFLRAIKGINTDKRQVYFEGSGITANKYSNDPYFRYLYRVDFSGKNLTRLTPEPMMHNTQLAPDFATFTDSFSIVSTPPEHVLRSTENGRILARLHTVDNRSLLEQNGYVAPQPFTVMAQDGSTPLHGILYFPSDFDASKSYPVIDDIYTGPHGYFTPKTYGGPLYAHAHALAELGFIVLKMDGRGTGKRDRAFHEYSYNNLAGGADDHVWALRKLAETRPYLDLDRVGIYGFSAGGYDTVRAMYKYPDFFKVGVSASGNHDFRVDKAGWNETWMGYPVGAHWDEQSNLTDANQLQGKLFLAHGELDENVHPAASLQLLDKFIKANKDVDFLLYPNMSHVLHYHPHFVRTRWDYFVRHLLGETPPSHYRISSMPPPGKQR